jgi:hypothetical protein
MRGRAEVCPDFRLRHRVDKQVNKTAGKQDPEDLEPTRRQKPHVSAPGPAILHGSGCRLR